MKSPICVILVLTANACAVLAKKPDSKNLVIFKSFRAMMGGKAMKDMMVAAECGCENSCDWELPR